MPNRPRNLWTQVAEGVAALSFAVMFFAFIVQVASRYIFNAPVAWTLELCAIAYVWVVFWTCGILVPERQQIVFHAQLAVGQESAVGADAQPVLGLLVGTINVRPIPPVRRLVEIRELAGLRNRVRCRLRNMQLFDAVARAQRVIGGQPDDIRSLGSRPAPVRRAAARTRDKARFYFFPTNER